MHEFTEPCFQIRILYFQLLYLGAHFPPNHNGLKSETVSQRNTFCSELFPQSIFFFQHEAKKLKLRFAVMKSECSRGNSVCLHSVRKPETFLDSWGLRRIYSSLWYDVYGAVSRSLHVFQSLCRHRPQLCVILLLPQKRALHLYCKSQFEYYLSILLAIDYILCQFQDLYI